MNETPQESNEGLSYVTIKEKLGREVDINEILTPEVIAASQTILDSAQNDFLIWVKDDMAGMEREFDRLVDPKTTDQKAALERFMKHVFSIKSRSGTFGFKSASHIGNLLYRFCETRYQPENMRHHIVLAKHIEALAAIFDKNITGEESKACLAVQDALAKLIHKYGD